MKKKIATIKQLKDLGLVTTASKVPPPPKKMFVARTPDLDLHIEENLAIVKSTWIKDVEDYCVLHGIEPWDLIEAHKTLDSVTKPTSRGKVEVKDLTAERAVGKAYDPFKNPTFKNKYGIK